MRHFTLFLCLLAFAFTSQAQAYFTKNGKISFFSSTPLEDIKADNNQVISVLNSNTGDIQFSLLNNAFHFKKALMEEHFNEDYIESAKFPKSTFKGMIANISNVNFATDGTYNITVSGILSIHGVNKTITAPGSITVKSGKISAISKFKIKPRDYGIRIAGAVKDNIAEDIELSISCQYEKR